VGHVTRSTYRVFLSVYRGCMANYSLESPGLLVVVARGWTPTIGNRRCHLYACRRAQANTTQV